MPEIPIGTKRQEIDEGSVEEVLSGIVKSAETRAGIVRQ